MHEKGNKIKGISGKNIKNHILEERNGETNNKESRK